MIFNAQTDDNRKLVVNWELVSLYAQKWKPNTKFKIEIKRDEQKRSDPMRKYYFVAVLPDYMEHLGYEKHEWELFHRQLKIIYFQIEPDKKGIYRNVPSVFGNKSDIPVSIKHKFVEWVIRSAARDGVIINDPMPV